MDIDVRSIARRAARSALARHAGAAASSAHAPATASLAPAQAPERPPVRDVVSVERLAGMAEGELLVVPDGAVVTPLAEDEARRRGIRLQRGPFPGRKRVAVGCDHGGFELKADVLTWVRELGHQPIDFGTRDTSPVDYPDFAQAVAEAVASGQADLGICIDGAGIGSAIAASKVPGVRAATCCDEAMARNAREHNYANVLSLGARMIDALTANGIVRAFLATPEGAERHGRRVAKITAIERRYSRETTPGAHR